MLHAGDLVVLRLPNWLGDAVMAEPIVRALAARGPLRLVASRRVHALWPDLEATVDRVELGADREERVEDYRGARLALLANGSMRSGACAFLARVPERIGFATGMRRAFLTRALLSARERGGRVPGRGVTGRFPRALPRPFTMAMRELATLAGIRVVDARPRLVAAASALAAARKRLAEVRVAGRLLLVHAGSRPGSAKGVPPAHLARMVERIAAERGLTPVLCCAPGEEASARLVHAALGGRAFLLDAPAPGVAELVAWTALAELVLTPDNGARHVAAALDVPAVVLVGPTDPRHTCEHAKSTRVVRAEIDCAPCHRERCPFHGERERTCFTSIDVETVASAACALEKPSTIARAPSSLA